MDEVALLTFSQVVLRNVESFLADGINLPRQLQIELQELSSLLESIVSVLGDAEKAQRTDKAVKEWLYCLQDAIYDLDDLLDEISLNRKKNQGNLHKPGSFCFSYLNPLSKHSQLSQKIQGICHILDVMVRERSQLRFDRSVSFTPEAQETSSYSYNNIVGRDEDKEQIMSWIYGPIAQLEGLSVVTIVGIGGIGKTALAQLIYRDRRIQDNFDIMAWVNVGDRFYIERILSQIITVASGKSLQVITLKEIITTLYELLRNKRYFLVLDDYRSSDVHVWRRFRELIGCGNRGSTIVVTTRDKLVASIFETKYAYQLKPLSEYGSFQLLMDSASRGVGIPNHPEFESIAREVVKHAQGLPLALTTLGGLLSKTSTVEECKRILDKSQWPNESKVIDVLELGYEGLPTYLKLPVHTFHLLQDRERSVDELICLWMALGFLQSDDRTHQPEYIGRNYLTEFVESCFLQVGKYGLDGVASTITVHDLICDLAKLKAGVQWAMIGRLTSKINENSTRYIVLDQNDLRGGEIPVEVLRAKQARAFIFYAREQTPAEFLRSIVSKFKCLRVLSLGDCDIEMLPDSIGDLKHLRYLDVARNSRMKRLPDSICNLLFLQTLLLHGCDLLKEVPKNIGRLQTLRYLTLTTQQQHLPDGIGDLNSLRTMGLDCCPRLACLPSSMKNLKNLQTLALVDCPELDLVKDSSVDGLNGLDVIETLLLVGLQKFEHLPSELETLADSLQHLHIQNCSNLTETTWIKQFFFLNSLEIKSCPGLLVIGDGSSQVENLEQLVIRDCQNLRDLTWIKQFISLYSLIIEDCPNLSTLGEGFSELNCLEWLKIKGCPQLTERRACDAGEDWAHIKHVPNIELD